MDLKLLIISVPRDKTPSEIFSEEVFQSLTTIKTRGISTAIISENISGDDYKRVDYLSNGERLYISALDKSISLIRRDVDNATNVMKSLSHNLSLYPEQVVVIGSSDSDLKLFKAVGTSVATRDSSKAILNEADFLTESWDEAGLEKFLKRYL